MGGSAGFSATSSTQEFHMLLSGVSIGKQASPVAFEVTPARPCKRLPLGILAEQREKNYAKVPLEVVREEEKSHGNSPVSVHSWCSVFFFKSIKEVLRMSNSSFYHSGNHCLCMEN